MNLFNVGDDIILNIFKFLNVKDTNSIYTINKYYYNLLKKNKWLMCHNICHAYNLSLYKKCPNTNYTIIIDNAKSFDEAIGAWHKKNDPYWHVKKIYKNISWLPFGKELSHVWWFDIGLEKVFSCAGRYDVWIRVKIDVPDTQIYNIITTPECATMKKNFSVDEFYIHKWIDINLGKCDVYKDQKIIFRITNIGTHMKQKHFYSFMYFVPSVGDDTFYKPNDINEFGDKLEHQIWRIT